MSLGIKGERQRNLLRLDLFNVDLVVSGTCYIQEFKVLFNGTMKCQNCKIRGPGQRSNTQTYIKGYRVPHIKNHYLLISPATLQIFVHLEALRHSGRNSRHWSYHRDKFSLVFKSRWVLYGNHYFTIMILGTYIASSIWKHQLNSCKSGSWWHFEDGLDKFALSLHGIICLFHLCWIHSPHPPTSLSPSPTFAYTDQNNTPVKSLLSKTNKISNY